MPALWRKARRQRLVERGFAASHALAGTLMSATEIAIVISSTLFASITAPIIISRRGDAKRHEESVEEAKIRKQEKEEDWARQDEVALRAQQAAEDLAESQRVIAVRTDEVARKTDDAAALLLAEQKTTNEKTDEVARIAANAVEQQERTARDLNGKLDQVHTLVNSAYDAALGGQLAALEQSQTLMLEKAASGDRTSAKALDILEDKVRDLKSLIADRAQQNATALKQRQESEVIVRVGAGPAGPSPDVDVEQKHTGISKAGE